MTAPPFAFDVATAVHPLGDGPAYAVDLDPQWSVGGRPHGGYLLAIIARAADAARSLAGTDHPHPLATSAQFLRSPATGPAEVLTEVLRTGRTVTHMRAVLRQDGHDIVAALLTCGRLEPGTAPVQVDDPVVELPPREQCVRSVPNPPGSPLTISIAEVATMDLDPVCLPDAVPPFDPSGPPVGAAEVRGWMSLADDRPQDPLSLLFTVDVSPPATFAMGLRGWVPTLELTTYVRALPAPGPVRFRQRSRLLQGGLIDELCDVWDSEGHLVAQASQLGSVRLV